jgi:hypothetical protein
MIIKLEYEDIGLVGIKTNYNNKVKNHYIRFIVDEYCVEKAIKEAENNKWVVALDYEGDFQYLFNLEEVPKIPVIITKEFTEINELSIAFFMTKVPDWVIVSIRTPEDFSDMRLVDNLSKQYSNIRFCGGKFLRLPSCRIGCIQREEIPSKIADSKISYYTEGCACAMVTMNIEDVEGVDLLFKEKEAEKIILKEENKKKIISSIEDLLSM